MPPAPPAAAPPPAPARDLPPPNPALRRAPQVIEPPLPHFGDSAPQQRRLALPLAWIASVLALLLLAAAVLVFRAEIASAWPPAVRFYAALGLDAGR